MQTDNASSRTPEESLALAQLDPEFETSTIESFKKENTGYTLHFSNGWSLFMRDAGFAPEVGQTAVLYGRGIGFEVRGLIVNNQVAYYRTAEEQKEQNRKACEARDAEKRVDYDANAVDYDLRVAALPAPFKARIMGFRNHNPDWKYDFEGYELLTCEQAVVVADALKSGDEVTRFYKLPFDEQRKLVPGLSDGHSGNSFGVVCLLARMYLERPDLVPMAHGAMCGLVGCKEYGCVAGRQPEAPATETSTQPAEEQT